MSHRSLLAGLAGLAAGKKLGAGEGVAELLKSSPQVSELVETIRGQLLTVGKEAAVAAAGSRIDDLSDRLQGRASSLRGRKAEQPAEEAEEEPEEPQEEPEDEAEEPEEEPERPAPRRRRRPSCAGRAARPGPAASRCRLRAGRAW